MNDYKKIIEKYKNTFNIRYALKILLDVFLLILMMFQIFNVCYNTVDGHEIELFYIALSLRVCAALLILYIIYSTKDKFLNEKDSARILDKQNDNKDDTLQSALELETEQPENPFLKKIISNANNVSENYKVNYPHIIPTKMRMFYVSLLIGNIVLFILFAGNFRSTWRDFYLTAMPKIEVDHSFIIAPQDSLVKSGSDLKIEITEGYEENIKYYLNTKIDKKWKKEQFQSSSITINDIDYSFSYFVESKNFHTDIYKVKVYDKIAVEQYKVIYDYPKYTKMKSVVDTLSYGNIDGIEGTKVKLLITINNTIKDGNLIFSNDSAVIGNKVAYNTIMFTMSLKQSKKFHLNIENIYNDIYISPDKKITVFPDLKPEIKLTDLPKNYRIDKNQLIPLTITATDDYGLQNLYINYEINSANDVDSLLKSRIPSKIIDFSMVLDLSNKKLYPNDEVLVWSSIEDNLGLKHRVDSEKILLTMPSLEELFSDFEEEEKEQQDLMNKTFKDSKKIKNEFEEKRRELLKKDNIDWQDKEDIKKIIKEQEEMNKNVDNAYEKMQEMIDEAQKNETLTSETIQKMEKIKELMSQIDTEDLRKTFAKMKEKMEDIDSLDLKKAMDEMKFSLEEFSDKLEQTIKMLEEIKKEQSLEKMSSLAKEMQKIQEEILKRNEENDDKNRTQQMQENNMRNLEEIKKEMNDFSEKLDKNKASDQKLNEELEKIKKDIDLDELMQKMQELQQQMKNNESNAQQQKSMLSEMQQLNQSLMNMMGMMKKEDNELLIAAKDKYLKEMFYLASNHKHLFELMNGDPFSIINDLIPEYEVLNTCTNKFLANPGILFTLSPKYMLDISQAMSNFSKLFIDVNDNKIYTANKLMKDIQINLHNVIAILLQENNNGSQSSGGGMQSFMQQMQQMSQQQMAMNMLAQQMMQQLQNGQKMTPGMRGKLRDMARSEQQLADNLQRMLQTNSEAQKNANSINKMIEELENVSKKLRYGRLDNDLIESQKNIISRMLEANKSINKKGKSKKRKGNSGTDKNWQTPEDIMLRYKELERDALLENQFKKYPKEYQKIILEYIKEMNRSSSEK